MLRPDYASRQYVNRVLSDRPALNSEEWFKSYFQVNGITRSVATFTYHYLGKYSGLQFARVLPSDRLEEDLRWTQVCSFDWEIMLCKDFCRCFGVDIDERIYEFTFTTVEDFVVFLNCQLLQLRPADKLREIEDMNIE
ncbi:hypothetical protein [Oculatella sp. LEGE 06141]|uniref:hypothetical protein n=1 Tax=Oculatella sp. LEGE 06141 TaxID=1828648 RepID=UPI001D146CDD|nr:hypothetical protein [Oculatella sp. LEGE 06141]